MLRAVERLESRGIHAVAIYSQNYEKTPMGPEQLEAVKSLVEYEKIPDGIQVLIINAAYETGLNIRPERSHLDYVIVHDIDPDTQIQARGRYRGDIDTVYHKDALDGGTVSIDLAKLSPYYGKKLRASEKKRLLSELGLRDGRGRPMGWPAFVKLLEEQGHTIEQGKTGLEGTTSSSVRSASPSGCTDVDIFGKPIMNIAYPYLSTLSL